MSNERMIDYLVRNTRYTKEELEKLPETTLKTWYREEVLCNKQK